MRLSCVLNTGMWSVENPLSKQGEITLQSKKSMGEGKKKTVCYIFKKA